MREQNLREQLEKSKVLRVGKFHITKNETNEYIAKMLIGQSYSGVFKSESANETYDFATNKTKELKKADKGMSR